MKVVLKRNLGRTLCTDLGLVKGDWDPKEFLEGSTHEFDGKALESLLAQGLVEEASKITKAVAKEPGITGK